MYKTATVLLAAVMVFALAGTAGAADLYWDPNETAAGFGSGGTWGTDSYWTTDGTGAFSDGGLGTTTSSDEVQVNNDPVSGFTMGVSGAVDAYRIVGIPSKDYDTEITDAGSGVLHLYASGSTNPLLSGAGDKKYTIKAPIVLEAAAGSDVYLAAAGGNNGNGTIDGDITSANSVDLYIVAAHGETLNGDINHNGALINDKAITHKNKARTFVNGDIGSNVTDVKQLTGWAGEGKPNIMTLTGTNSYTGDTIINDSYIETNNTSALPDTTIVRIDQNSNATEIPYLELNFTGEDTVAGLYFKGVQQDLGTWGATGSGADNINDTYFAGSGKLNVIPEPASLALIGIGGIGVLLRRRRA